MNDFKPEHSPLQDDPCVYVAGHGFVGAGGPNRERQHLTGCATATGAAFLLALFLQSVLPVAIIRCWMLFSPDLRYFNAHLMAPEWVVQTIGVLSVFLCAVIPFWLYAVALRIPLGVALPLRRPRVSALLSAVLIAMGVAVLGSLAATGLNSVLHFFRRVPILPNLPIPTNAQGLLLAFFTLCVLPAVVEEFMYRGMILQSLRRFGDGFAVLVSAILFSLMHMNLAQAPSSLLMGLALGYFVISTGSLWTGVAIHFCNNLLVLLQQTVLMRLDPREGDLLVLCLMLCCLLLALIAVIFMARGEDHAFALCASDSALACRTKLRLFFSNPMVLVLLVLTLTTTFGSVQNLP